MKIFLVLLCFFSISANAQNALFNSKDLKSFEGRWIGKLEYRDYSNDKINVSLPVTLEIINPGDSLVLNYTYTEPSGKQVKNREVWKIISNGEQLRVNNEIADISVVNRERNRLGLTVYRLGMDNDKSAMIEKAITLTSSSFDITKRVKYDSGGEYFVRNVYTFRKN